MENLQQPIEQDREADRMPNDPSPEEIRRECEKIREEWSERETLTRAGTMAPKPWKVPRVREADED